MSLSAVVEALALPPDSRIDKRVPKKMLVEQGAPTAADKKQIQEGIEELLWIAALKPNNIGVPEYKDSEREYMEIAVLTVALRPAAKITRLIELVHRAVPYPVALIAELSGAVTFSAAHKRFSQAEGGRMVVDELRKTNPFRMDALTQEEAAFVESIALSRLPSQDMFALYQGWLDRVAALEAASITGDFAPPETTERAGALRGGLESHSRIQRELATLRAQAAKEKQINRRVDLNLQIKRLEAELSTVDNTLCPEKKS